MMFCRCATTSVPVAASGHEFTFKNINCRRRKRSIRKNLAIPSSGRDLFAVMPAFMLLRIGDRTRSWIGGFPAELGPFLVSPWYLSD